MFRNLSSAILSKAGPSPCIGVGQWKLLKITLPTLQIQSNVSGNTGRYFLSDKNQQNELHNSQGLDILKVVKLGR